MKPINYTDKIPGRYIDTLTPVNKTVRVLNKTRIMKIKIKKWIHFWALMIGFSSYKKH